MKEIYLFAYGSMKKCFKNHHRLVADKFLGEAITIERYNMYPAASYNYPYGIENEQKWQLEGELYELTSTDIDDIDIFEGTPEHYYRKEIKVLCRNKLYAAFIYFRASNNPKEMDNKIALYNLTKEFELVGEKYNDFMDALGTALMKKMEDLLNDKNEILSRQLKKK